MKVLIVILVLAVAGNLRAQDIRAEIVPAPDIGTPATHYALVVPPSATKGGIEVSRFWRPSTLALVALDGAAKAVDAYATRKNIDAGGLEYDPLARPFVHTTGVQVASMAALFGAEMMGAYAFHQRHHDFIGHALLAAGALMNGLGAAFSIQHREANW